MYRPLLESRRVVPDIPAKNDAILVDIRRGSGRYDARESRLPDFPEDMTGMESQYPCDSAALKFTQVGFSHGLQEIRSKENPFPNAFSPALTLNGSLP